MPTNMFGGLLGGVFGDGGETQIADGQGQAAFAQGAQGLQRGQQLNTQPIQQIASTNRSIQGTFQYHPRPQTEGEVIYNYLLELNYHLIKEIVIPDNKFKLLVGHLRLENHDPSIPINIVSFNYHVIKVRNADYILDLDKFMEDAPPCPT